MATQPGETGSAVATAPEGSDGAPVHPAEGTGKPGASDASGTSARPAGSGPARAAAATPARNSKVLLPADASPSAWASSIARFTREKNVVALQAIAEAVPGRTREERAQLAALSVRALASLGAPAKPTFDDLLVSSDRTLRLAAFNAYAVTPALYGTASERQETLEATSTKEPDPVIRAKVRALLAALR